MGPGSGAVIVVVVVGGKGAVVVVDPAVVVVVVVIPLAQSLGQLVESSPLSQMPLPQLGHTPIGLHTSCPQAPASQRPAMGVHVPSQDNDQLLQTPVQSNAQ
jgi:hypothetical protein